MTILGIESTCDETSVGIVKNGKELIANVVASSSLMHKKYGGVVPEVAAREQVKVIIPTLKESLDNIAPDNIDAIAVAHGPGLVGSLLIGVECAKTLALVWNKPLISVNHLVGHLAANWIDDKRRIMFPAVGLVVSGGHTDLIYMESHNKTKHLGGTRDDAAGEVFDKVARILGLPYPGGPEVEEAAKHFKGKSNRLFPRPMIGDMGFDFSFSGLKTAVANLVKIDSGKSVEEIAYEFQEAIVDVLVSKTARAVEKFIVNSVVVGGGVAANGRLQEKFARNFASLNIYFPAKGLAIDNGAMIAAAAYYHQNNIDPLKLSANPSLYF